MNRHRPSLQYMGRWRGSSDDVRPNSRARKGGEEKEGEPHFPYITKLSYARRDAPRLFSWEAKTCFPFKLNQSSFPFEDKSIKKV